MNPARRPLPASMTPFLGGFRRILQRVARIPGFFLLPVEIPGPDVAHALAELLTDEGHPALVLEPRDDGAMWRDLAAALYRPEPAPKRVVVMIGSDNPPDAVHAGLRLLNQQRDTLATRLACPLLWCGPASFLQLCWREAPDFWSVRSTDIRLEEAPAEEVSLADATSGADPERELREALALRGRGRLLASAVTLGALLARPDPAPRVRLLAQLALAGVLEDGGDLSRAEATYREALAEARAQEDLESEAHALIGAYGIAARTGRAAEAEEPLAKARSIAERLGLHELATTAATAQAMAAIGGHDAKKGEERIAEAKALGAGTSLSAEPVDALVVTALQAELDAVLALGEGGRAGWHERRDLGGFRYYRRALPAQRGETLHLAAAWLGEMGERTAAIRGQQLIAELDPECLAMCGICAGLRGEVALGDVIVADRLYSYDHGKLIAEPSKDAGHHHDVETYNLENAWKMDAAYLAQELDLSALARDRPPSKAAQRWWLLHALYAHEAEGGPAPLTHPERKTACPGWSARVAEAMADELVSLDHGTLALTGKGRRHILNERTLFPEGLAAEPPLRVHVGAIATGKTVRQDPELFTRLRRLVRGTLGVEMEGAAIGELAARSGKRAIVIKAVSDHADFDKDDSFREFACRASATVLMAFLQEHLDPARTSPAARRETPDLAAPVERFDRRDDFLARVERVAKLRDPAASLTRRAAPGPFAGVLEIAHEGALVDVQVVGAVDQPITEALVTRYLTEVERPYRQGNPSLGSTLIHTGPQAPLELARVARRRGVVLKTFAEYQGLLDFTRYLDWQTRALETDDEYRPWLYVEQPAKWSLAGGREEQTTDDALSTLWELLEAPHPRLVLVLGDFGAGKTFLLHELARRMAKDKHPLVPVLVEMSRLQKQRSLKALLAEHFAMTDMGRFDPDAFMYMLAEGRVALLFDGFDELSLRPTYDRAAEHFDTVVAAARGNAKVVVTSRTQHFLTDQQVRLALAERAEQLPGYRLLQLEKFGEKQIRRFLGNMIVEPREAEERYHLLHEVKDLLGLSENPRMLGFIAKIDAEALREAKRQSGEITAAKLYEVLIGEWLDHEYDRANPPGVPRGISRGHLGKLVSNLAAVLWARNARALHIDEFSGVLVMEEFEPAVVEHMIGSGSLLVRDADGRFSFVHRSVMEWLVADAAAREVRDAGDAAVLAQDEMSALMADFFVSLATPLNALEWAQDKAAGAADGHAKKNAAQVLKRAKALGRPLSPTLSWVRDGLRGRDWSGVNWRGESLDDADLRNATLIEAKLEGASLLGARLERVNMRGADLRGADLTGAGLAFANLMSADLRQARGLTAAQLRGAKLVGAQGVEVEGLAEVGAAPPELKKVEPMWAPSRECSSVAWSPSGDLLASGHNNSAVVLWDAISGRAIRVLSGHSDWVRSVAFSPDGKTLASGSYDRTVRLWDVATANFLRAFEGHTDRVWSVAFSPDGKTLASGSSDKTVRLWDVATATCLRVLEGHKQGVLCVAFSPDRKTLASGSSDKTVRLWDVIAVASIRVLDGHTMGLASVAFSPDGNTLASGSYDRTVRLWNVATATPLGTLEGHGEGVNTVAFSPDGKTLASGADNKVRLWDVTTTVCLHVIEGHEDRVWSVAFSSNGTTLASGSYDKTVRLWDVATATALRALEGNANGVRSVVFSPDGKTLASGSYDKTARLWNVTVTTCLRAFEGHGYGVLNVAFSPDGKTLASGAYDKMVRLWDVAKATCLRTFKGHANEVLSIAFSPDGETLASGAADKTMRLWEVATASPLRAFQGHASGVRSVAFSPDGKTLASASEDMTVRLWDVAAGTSLRIFEGHTNWVWSVAFSPDGKTLASGASDKMLRLWNVATASCLRAFEGHTDSVLSVAFRPDGKVLASGSNDTTVRLWDVAAGTSLRIFEGHTNWVWSVAFSPDGKTLASASEDGTIRFWDVATGRCLAVLVPMREGWAAFTPDGRYKLGGDIGGSFWHVIGLCRFEPGELDPYVPGLRVPDGEPLIAVAAERHERHDA